MQKAKLITIRRSKNGKNLLVQGPFYTRVNPKSLLKRRKTYKQNQIDRIEKGALKPTETEGRQKTFLFLHYGENWVANEKLHFYRQFFSEDGAAHIGADSDGESSALNSDFELLEEGDVNFN